MEWEITKEGHLTVTGEGDYDVTDIQFGAIQGPEWLKYHEYIYTGKIDIKNITSTELMFDYCSSLKTLDLSGLDTSNVTNMGCMFEHCSSLKTLDLSNFNTSNVTCMWSMFEGCMSLTALDLSNFDTSNVKDIMYMFAGCTSLTTLDLSNFNTSNATNMLGMFCYCSNLKTLDISNFNTSAGMSDIFYKSNALEKLYFFANSSYAVELPSLTGYCWINEDNEICTKTAKLNRKMTYTRIIDNRPIPPTIDDDINTGIYSDSSCTTLAALSARTQYVNGGNVKQSDGTKNNYKTKYYYTNLQASDIVTTDKKGKTKTKKGKLVVGITSSINVPVIINGKIKDTSASKIASASISKGKIKVTAKSQPGIVYLWVMDTGDAKAYAYAKIVINAAPSKVQIFAKSSDSEGFSPDKKNVYKKDSIELGDTVKLYVYPSYKLNGQMKETKDASYSVSVATQSDSYFTATQDPDDPYCFNVTAKALKNNKKTTGKITITCNENGKKAVFTATAVNSVQSITLSSVTSMADDTASGAAVSEFTITKSDTDKKTGSFIISTTKSNDKFETTDKVKLYAMGKADGFDKAQMEKGKTKITVKPDSNQKKLTAKLDKDKKTVTVTAAKKIPAGTYVYYLIMYNNKEGTGYKVIKITTV